MAKQGERVTRISNKTVSSPITYQYKFATYAFYHHILISTVFDLKTFRLKVFIIVNVSQ